MKHENYKLTITVKGHEPVHTTTDDLARLVKMLKRQRKARKPKSGGKR